jgi:hypothetical protein
MDQSYFWEANSSSTDQQVTRLLWNKSFLAVALIVDQLNPVNMLDNDGDNNNNVYGGEITTFLNGGHQRTYGSSPWWYMRIENYGGMISTG